MPYRNNTWPLWIIHHVIHKQSVAKINAMKEVAYACGFSDPNYFSKSFKSNTGQTPKEYREKCNN